MFRRLHEDGPRVRFTFEGDFVEAMEGETVAAALLAHGVISFRQTPVSGAARGPWCLIGDCFECLVEIDGRQNVQACQVQVTGGMKVRRQIGVKQVKL